MRQCLLVWMLALGLVFQFGCGGSGDTAGEADGSGVAEADEAAAPEQVSPLEMLPEQESDKPATIPEPAAALPEPEPQPQPETEPQPEPVVEVELDTSVASAVHPNAGRSAFPDRGETIEVMITAKRLSDIDPFSDEFDPDNIPAVVPWHKANNYVDYEITVQGKIVSTGQSRDGGVKFLNFHEDWRGKFYMVLFDDLAEALPKSVDETFRNKTVRVKGTVEDHRGRPQIRILSMDQVEFVD
ncbi:MAG: hypothetical protein AAGB26_02930 [Planctomycetota bacterium]